MDRTDRLRKRVLWALCHALRAMGVPRHTYSRRDLVRYLELDSYTESDVSRIVEALEAEFPLTVTSQGVVYDTGESADKVKRQALDVFTHWQQATGHTRTKPTQQRLGHIHARLRDGYSVGELKAAIDGMMQDDFLVQGGYTKVSNALGSAEKVDRLKGSARTKETHYERAVREARERRG